MSRLVEVEQGKTMPLLEMIAQAKFVEWDPSEYMAFWKDKNSENETWDNVELTHKWGATRRESTRTQYGAPAGTPAYYREYRKQNKEKFKKYMQTQKDRNRIETAVADSPPAPPTVVDEGESLLSELRGLVGEATPREPGQ